MMIIRPTPLTAALAGVFSAVMWHLIWARLGGSANAGSFDLIIGTILIIVLPAHLFVLGFGSDDVSAGRKLDSALLKRIAIWLAAAAVTALVGAAIRA